MDIKYEVINPTGNITVLVTDPVMIEDQPSVAADLLKKEPTAEQVGYVQFSENRVFLRMAGGEFCGNATMGAAALYFRNNNLEDNSSSEIDVEVAGVRNPIKVTVTRNGNEYKGKLNMPSPNKITYERFSFEGREYHYPLVEFATISHIVVEDKMPVYMAERAIKLWCDKLHSKCLGFMMLNEDKTELRPLVYATNPETLYWESSCASGTTAVAAFLKYRERKEINLSLSEPGGTLKISTTPSGELLLEGKVTF